jgi:hypothetical protein
MIKNCIGININEINKGIDFYRANHNGEYPNYLVMNTKSYSIMKSTMEHTLDVQNILYKTEYSPSWHGIPLAICERLDIGEVDFV